MALKQPPSSEYEFRLDEAEQTLTAVPKTPAALARLCEVERLCDPTTEPQRYIDMLVALEPVQFKRKDWRRCKMTTDFGEEHVAAVQRWTGPFECPAFDITDILGPVYGTHILVRAEFDNGKVEAAGFHSHYQKREQAWSDEQFENRCQAYAEKSFARNIREELGYVEPTPEYIPAGGDTYRRNPNWGRGQSPCLKRIPPYGGDVHEAICDHLWRWWVDNLANERQKAILAAGHFYYRKNDQQWPNLREYNLYYRCSADDPNGIPYSADGAKARVMTREEFRKLR